MTTYTLTEATRQRLMEIADMNADHESFALLNAAPSTSPDMSDDLHIAYMVGYNAGKLAHGIADAQSGFTYKPCPVAYTVAAPSTSLTEAQVTAAIDKWFSREFEYNYSMETRMRAAIESALATKGGA